MWRPYSNRLRRFWYCFVLLRSICLAEKGEYDKARIVAGAINEVSPGNKAALNIISFCEGH